MEGLDVVAANFPRQRYQGLSPVGLTEIQVGVTELDMELHTATDNFAPNEYRRVVNQSGLAVYKGSNTRYNDSGDCNRKSLCFLCQSLDWLADTHNTR